jgi:Holliday junction resolvase RusA-like endonuclease
MKARHEIIKVAYPGSVISVNHYKFRHYTRPEAKAFMEDIAWLVKRLHLEEWTLPLTITCDGYFKSLKKRPDLSNLAKTILDAIQLGSGVNDKNFKWNDGDVFLSKEPYLLITIKEATKQGSGELTRW